MSETQPALAAGDARMERLSFAESAPYEAIEAAIHLNRYLLARSYCAGRRVLDVGCGEGYGAYLMAEHWGATQVDAVDISEEALAAAQQCFDSPRIKWRQHNAERLGDLFDAPRFDLVVVLETIEHLRNPAALLEGVRRVLAPGGVVVISCPNDHWYYRTPQESNPFHVRKYTLAEFRTLTESQLGPAAGFLLGAPLAGFVNLTPAAHATAPPPGMLALLAAAQADTVLRLPAQSRVESGNSRYYVGVWGPVEPADSAVIYPCSLEESGPAHRALQVENLRDEVVHLRTRLHELDQQPRWLEQARAEAAEARASAAQLEQARAAAEQARAASEAARAAAEELRAAAETAKAAGDQARLELERDLRHARLRLAAVRAENEYMREEAGRAFRRPDQPPLRATTETDVNVLRENLAEQARLVDERDAYIRRLEEMVNSRDADLQRIAATYWWRTRRLIGRVVRPILRRVRP
ncbi:MAG: class I SAM-dependent methyltransferase [Planctomycetota bacterium]